MPFFSLQFVQMLQTGQDYLLARLLDFPSQEYLVKDGVYLVEVEYQIQFAHVPKERVQHLDKEMNGFQVCKLIIIRVDAGAEEQPCVPTIHDLGRIPELDEVGLVLLITRRNQTVDFAF